MVRRAVGRSLIIGALCLLVILMPAAGPAARPAVAHGGGAPQLTNEPVGPYLLSLWSDPDPAVVGALHLTLAVADAASGAPVTAAEVTVTARNGATRLTAPASHEGALVPEFYEVDFDLPAAGEWQFDINISGEAGSGQAGFALTAAAGATNWLLIALVGLGGAAAGWVGWLLWRGKKQRG
jgi:hypothetical protein